MADVLLLHHALGLTAGVRAFADALREAGHTVVLPDLYEGRSFSALAEAGGELFLYPGSGHLIADASFSDYQPEQAGLILARTLGFLGWG